jgi:hypothetical protein
MNSTVLAKMVLRYLGIENIGSQLCLTAQQTKGVAFDYQVKITLLLTDRTIALDSDMSMDGYLKADRSTVTAPLISSATVGSRMHPTRTLSSWNTAYAG